MLINSLMNSKLIMATTLKSLGNCEVCVIGCVFSIHLQNTFYVYVRSSVSSLRLIRDGVTGFHELPKVTSEELSVESGRHKL